jgi:dimethylargininase
VLFLIFRYCYFFVRELIAIQMFNKAIVRAPARSMTLGLTSARLGIPDYNLALKQHDQYIKALKRCGIEVICLEADENFPDSTFVEDVALLTKHCAIITNPGAPSRRGEIQEMGDLLKNYYSNIYQVSDPGTVEAGDIMMAGDHFYIGLSERTNKEGAMQVIAILEKHDMTGSIIPLSEVLHLKTGLAYLENNNLLACGEFLDKPEFNEYNILEIEEDESYAANCIWVNNTVLIPSGYPKARSVIQEAGYEIIEVDVSEFRKLDGGLSCLSLRF